jgi:hypothetical protein
LKAGKPWEATEFCLTPQKGMAGASGRPVRPKFLSLAARFLYTLLAKHGEPMAENVTNELMYEVLKKLQAGQAEIKATLADVVTQLIRVREEINSVRSDDLRRERVQSQIDVRLERIETRLDLHDPHQ